MMGSSAIKAASGGGVRNELEKSSAMARGRGCTVDLWRHTPVLTRNQKYRPFAVSSEVQSHFSLVLLCLYLF
jgi:hypothetical protein